MGEIIISGRAKGEFAYDYLDVLVTFIGEGVSTSKALNNLLEQCEKFLELVTKLGISIDDIRMDEDNLDYHTYSDEKYYQADRRIIIRVPYDMGYLNDVAKIIEENDFSARISHNPILSNEGEIRTNLVKKAIEDADSKANLYLNGLKQKIVGIKSIATEVSRYDYGIINAITGLDEGTCERFHPFMFQDKIQAATQEVDETVTITYLIG